MDKITVDDLYQTSLTLSREDRQALKNLLLENLKDEVWANFGPGDKVKFKSRKGAVITGTIVRVNAKSVKVVSKQDRYGYTTPGRNITWTVHPSFITAA